MWFPSVIYTLDVRKVSKPKKIIFFFFPSCRGQEVLGLGSYVNLQFLQNLIPLSAVVKTQSQRETLRQIISPNRLCPVTSTPPHLPPPFTISLSESPPFMPLVSGRPSFPPSGIGRALSLSLAPIDDMGQ